MSLFWKRITSATAVQADSAIHLYHLLKPDDADRRKSRYWLTVIDGAIKEGSVSAVSVCVCVCQGRPEPQYACEREINKIAKDAIPSAPHHSTPFYTHIHTTIKNPDNNTGAASSLIMLDNDDSLRDETTPSAEIRLSCLTCTLP